MYMSLVTLSGSEGSYQKKVVIMVRHKGPQRVETHALPQDNGGASNVKVVVRVRPENQWEKEGNHRIVVREFDEHVLVFDPKEEFSPGFYHGKQRKGRDIMKKRNKDIKYAFDYVYHSQMTNREVYDNTTKGIVDSLLDGYNCSGSN